MAWLSASLDLFRVFAGAGGSRVLGVGSCAEYDWSAGLCTEEATALHLGPNGTLRWWLEISG